MYVSSLSSMSPDYPVYFLNFSPITEASDEDSKSSGTSSIDSLHTDSSAYGGPTSLHAKSTAPSLSTVKELSLEAAGMSYTVVYSCLQCNGGGRTNVVNFATK